MKKLSVILPTYNIEKHLFTSLNSIVNQTYKNLEIIVIDDNSSDNTVTIIKEFTKKDSRIKVIQNKINIGPGPSRNLGIKNSTGYYLTFMDHDDWQNLDRYEKMIDRMEKDNSEVCFSYAKDYLENEDRYIDTGYPKFHTGPINFKKERKKFFHSFFPPWSKIYLSSLIKNNNIKFAECGVKFDDVLFHSLLIFTIKKASVVSEYSYFHRVFEQSITFQHFEDKEFMNKEFISTMKQAIQINPSRQVFKYYFKLIQENSLSKKDMIFLFKKNPVFFLFSIKNLKKILKTI